MHAHLAAASSPPLASPQPENVQSLTMRILLAALATLLSACAASAQPAPALPPEYPYPHWNGLAEPLWGSATPRDSVRLLMARPHFRRDAYATISIDRRSEGAIGTLTRADRAGGYEWAIHEQRRFPVSANQLAQLDALIAASRLWRNNPEFWVLTDPDAICIHGVELVLERANAEGYRFSSANAQCTAPSDYKAVAAYMITLANEPVLQGWLR